MFVNEAERGRDRKREHMHCRTFFDSSNEEKLYIAFRCTDLFKKCSKSFDQPLVTSHWYPDQKFLNEFSQPKSTIFCRNNLAFMTDRLNPL